MTLSMDTETRADLMGRAVRAIQDYTSAADFDGSGIPLETDANKDITTEYQ